MQRAPTRILPLPQAPSPIAWNIQITWILSKVETTSTPHTVSRIQRGINPDFTLIRNTSPRDCDTDQENLKGCNSEAIQEASISIWCRGLKSSHILEYDSLTPCSLKPEYRHLLKVEKWQYSCSSYLSYSSAHRVPPLFENHTSVCQPSEGVN